MSNPPCPHCTAEMVRDAVFSGRRCTGKLTWRCVVCKGRRRTRVSLKDNRRVLIPRPIQKETP